MKTTERAIRKQLDEIGEKLANVEEHMAWLITPDARFCVGQRVEWSRRGRNRGFPSGKVAQKGTIKGINSFSITVKLDRLKKEKSFHHAFFNPVSGPKLF